MSFQLSAPSLNWFLTHLISAFIVVVCLVVFGVCINMVYGGKAPEYGNVFTWGYIAYTFVSWLLCAFITYLIALYQDRQKELRVEHEPVRVQLLRLVPLYVIIVICLVLYVLYVWLVEKPAQDRVLSKIVIPKASAGKRTS